jgi:molybdate transport system regulatory protein
MDNSLNFSLKVIMSNGIRFGRGKAELMLNISELGSISAAAKKMGMSYPRASRLTRDINTMFGEPIIETFQGGPDKGGARLTEKGHNILKAYQNWAQDIAEGSVALKAQFLPFD